MRYIAPLIMLSLLVACSGGEGRNREISARLSPTSEATTPEFLRRLLLTLEDMPPGYSVWMPNDEDDEEDECSSPIKATVRAEASYAQGDFGPFILHLVAGFRSSIEAAAAMETARILLTGPCATSVDEDGITTTLRSASYPKIGDETIAYNVSVSSGFLPVTGRAIIVRKDQIITVVMMIAVGPADLSPLDGLIRKAHSKLP